MKLPQFLYHYTVGSKLPLIAENRQLVPNGFALASSSRERPVLWFSENEVWEPTATKVISLDGKTFRRPQLDELHEIATLHRFRLATPQMRASGPYPLKPIHWTQLPTVAHIAKQDAQAMVTSGLNLGARPMQWWGVLAPVSLDWQEGALTLEVCTQVTQNGPVWEPVTFDRALKQWEAKGVQIRHLAASSTPAAMGI